VLKIKLNKGGHPIKGTKNVQAFNVIQWWLKKENVFFLILKMVYMYLEEKDKLNVIKPFISVGLL
jgi:hypothetical protein